MVREPISKMKSRKAAGPSGVLSEMVRAAREAGVGIMTDLVNQIIVEGTIPGEWEFNAIINRYKGKGNSLERGNYRVLKLIRF